jgi:hypothetical protein
MSVDRETIDELVGLQDRPAIEGQGVVFPSERYQKPFVEAVRGLGGSYMGTATHQNFTHIAAGRFDDAYIVDRSTSAINTLKLHRLLHLHKESPDRYIDFWTQHPRYMVDEIKTWGADGDEVSGLSSLVIQHGVDIGTILYFDRSDANNKPEKGKRSWLASMEDYTYVREMFASGKIQIVNADFQNGLVMDRIATRVRREGLTFNALYLSNVEDHLAGKIQEVAPGDIKLFWKNLELLPRSDKTVMLRTIRTFGNISPDGTFYYVVQPMANFLEMGYRSYDQLLLDISGQITENNLGVTVMPVPKDQRDDFLSKRGWTFP